MEVPEDKYKDETGPLNSDPVYQKGRGPEAAETLGEMMHFFALLPTFHAASNTAKPAQCLSLMGRVFQLNQLHTYRRMMPGLFSIPFGKVVPLRLFSVHPKDLSAQDKSRCAWKQQFSHGAICLFKFVLCMGQAALLTSALCINHRT